MKELIEFIAATVIGVLTMLFALLLLVLFTPLGWAGMLCLALVIKVIK